MKSILPLKADQLAGVFTLLLVAILDLSLLFNASASDFLIYSLSALYITFFILFSVNSSSELPQRWEPWRLPILGVQYVLIGAVFATSPNMFTAILLVMWSAQLPYFMSFRTALLTAPLWSAFLWGIHFVLWSWQVGNWITAILFFTFNIFALVMMESRRLAEESKQQAEQANSELRAAQALLQEASQRDERNRIGRDIHDVVGHHLTALTIQLQLLRRKIAPEFQADVDQAHGIAKLLLADVRAAVSDMRDHEHLNLRQVIEQLFENIHWLQVHLELPEEIPVHHVETATTVLRCLQEILTNSTKHGKATDLWVRLTVESNALVLKAHNKGKSALGFRCGHGLLGMQERVSGLGGRIEITPSEQGMAYHIVLPLVTTRSAMEAGGE